MSKGVPELRKQAVKLATAKRLKRGSAVLRMARAGQLQKLRPGLYRPSAAGTWANQDLADACLAVPKGVICLISALAFHGLTTTIPMETWIAIPRTSRVPSMAFPTRFVRLGEGQLTSGIEMIKIGRTRARIFSKSKSVCDALRFRDKVGHDVAYEALKTFLRQGGRPDELIRWEVVCRIRTTLRSQLQVLMA